MKRAPIVLAALCALALPAQAATAPCTPQFRDPQMRRAEVQKTVQKVEGKRYVVAWHPVPEIQVSEFFALEIAVCSADGQPEARTIRVDATMPEHQHGMNYRASVRPRGPGLFVAEGLLFHMPGRWQLSFEVNIGAAREVLTADVVIR